MKILLQSLAVSLVLLILCGFIYPLGMTGVGQLLFHKQANGSIMEYNGEAIGSGLLGQNFTDERYFHGRVSAYNYNTYEAKDLQAGKDGKPAYAGVGSGSANLAPSNPALAERVEKDIEAFLKANPDVKKEDIPTDLLTSSGSGLDPHISPQAARIQIPAISNATGMDSNQLEKLVGKYTEGRTWGIFGEPRFNVLKANMEIAASLKARGETVE